MARQAGQSGAPLRSESRSALVSSPRPSRAPSLVARARPPGPLGAAWRPGGGRCGALGRWRLRRQRRALHSVGPLSCPPLHDTSLGAGGTPPRTPFRPSRLGSAHLCAPQRRRAGPVAALRFAPLARPAPLCSRPSARAAPCLSRALPGPPVGPPPGPSGFFLALAVRRSRFGADSARAPRRLLPEFRLGRATWLPAAPKAPDARTPGFTWCASSFRFSFAPLRRPQSGTARGSRWPCPLSLSPSSAVRTP